MHTRTCLKQKTREQQAGDETDPGDATPYAIRKAAKKKDKGFRDLLVLHTHPISTVCTVLHAARLDEAVRTGLTSTHVMQINSLPNRRAYIGHPTPNHDSHLFPLISYSLLIFYSLIMFSIFAFILLLNGVLALPSPVRKTDSLVSIKSDISPTRTRQALNARQALIESSFIVPMNCTGGTTCTVMVGIGSPPNFYTMLVDTGSSNTWVGAGKPYLPSSSTVQTGQQVAQKYGFGSFSGQQVNDAIFLPPNIHIQSQGIGNASFSEGFEGLDGILGIGPKDLTVGTTSPSVEGEVPTVVDRMQAEGLIKSGTVGIFIPPAPPLETVIGALSFGSLDETKVTEEINLLPTSTSTVASAKDFWALDGEITLGSSTLLSNGPITVDTGNSRWGLASDVFNAYKQATGATLDSTGFLKLSAEQFASLPNLTVTVLGSKIDIPPNAQRSTTTDGTDNVFLSATDLGSDSTKTFAAIFGIPILQHYYTSLDTSGLIAITPTKDTNTFVS